MQVCLRAPDAGSDTLGTTDELLRRATGGVAQVFRYWNRKRGSRDMPSSDDIDFLELRPWLPGIMLVEVTPGFPRDLIYRVVGERAVRQRGYDPSGMSVRQAAHGHSIDDALETYGTVVDRRLPLYCWDEPRMVAGQVSNTLALPLSRDGKNVDRVLVYGEDRAAQRTA
jgi:hypothetical protein